MERMAGSAARWGAILTTVFLAALGAAPLWPADTVLAGVASGFSAWIGGLVGMDNAIGFRAGVTAATLILIATPLTSRFRAPGPAWLLAPLAALGGLALGAALALGLGADIIRQAALDPGAPPVRAASVVFQTGYAIGWLGLVEAAAAEALPALEAWWPAFGAAEARLGPELNAPASALVFAGLMSFAALCVFWVAAGAAWFAAAALFGPRALSWRSGAARILVAGLFSAALLALAGLHAPGASDPDPNPTTPPASQASGTPIRS